MVTTCARVIASFAPGCPARWRDSLDDWTDAWAAGIELLEEPDDALVPLLARDDVRIRFASRDRVPAPLRRAAAGTTLTALMAASTTWSPIP